MSAVDAVLWIAVIALGIASILQSLHIRRLNRELWTVRKVTYDLVTHERFRRRSLIPEQSVAEFEALVEQSKKLLEDM